MSKTFDLTAMGIGAVVASSNLYNSEVDRFNGIVSDEKLASHLASITTSDKTTDALGIAKAFHAWCVTKEDAKREGYKNESDLLMSLTGLGKSSISQLRTVGSLFADDNGAFYMPDALKGYTVGQVYEVMSKNKGIVTADDFAVICDENDITCATSAKAIREKFEHVTPEERDKINNAKALKSARNKLVKDGVTIDYKDENGNVIAVFGLLEMNKEAFTQEQRKAIIDGTATLTINF